MFLELIATIFAGIAAAGVVMILNRVSGGRLPRWLAPVGAGAAMIAATIASEYGWYDRTAGALPEGVEVVQVVENRSLYRPWTYLVPYVERFAAIDTGSLKRNPDLPDQRIADLWFFGRWSPVRQATVLADCAGARRAILADTVTFEDSGAVIGADWVDVPEDDAVLSAVCGVS